MAANFVQGAGTPSQTRIDYKSLSRPRLDDLLARHEKLAQNRVFMDKLKDKGEKLRRTVEDIKEELKLRDLREKDEDYLKATNLVQQFEWLRLANNVNRHVQTEGGNPASEPVIPVREGVPDAETDLVGTHGHNPSEQGGDVEPKSSASTSSQSSSMSMLKRTRQNLQTETEQPMTKLLSLKELTNLLGREPSSRSGPQVASAHASVPEFSGGSSTLRPRHDFDGVVDWVLQIKQRYKYKPHVFDHFQGLMNEMKEHRARCKAAGKPCSVPRALETRWRKFFAKHQDISHDMCKFAGIDYAQLETEMSPDKLLMDLYCGLIQVQGTPQLLSYSPLFDTSGHVVEKTNPTAQNQNSAEERIASTSGQLESLASTQQKSVVIQAGDEQPVAEQEKAAASDISVLEPLEPIASTSIATIGDQLTADDKVYQHKFVPFRYSIGSDDDADSDEDDEEEGVQFEGEGHLDPITEESEED